MKIEDKFFNIKEYKRIQIDIENNNFLRFDIYIKLNHMIVFLTEKQPTKFWRNVGIKEYELTKDFEYDKIFESLIEEYAKKIDIEKDALLYYNEHNIIQFSDNVEIQYDSPENPYGNE